MIVDRQLIQQKQVRIPVWLWAALVGLHLLALSWQLTQRHYLFPDSDRYVQAARNLHSAGVLYALPLQARPLQLQEYSIRPPGYPVFLLLTGGIGRGLPWLPLVLQNVLSLLNMGLALRWLARLTGGLPTRQWLLVLGLAAAAPAQFMYANVLMSEMLLQTAVVVVWLCLTAVCTQPARIGSWVGLAAGAAAALLIKPVFWPFAGVVLALGLGWGWQQRRAMVVVVAMFPLLAAIGWMSRNEARTGYFHFSSITEINLLRYNVRGVLQAAEGPAAAEQFVRGTLAAAGRQPSFAAQQHYVQQAALPVLLHHPVTYGLQQLRGMLAFFLDPGRFDVVHFFQASSDAGGGLLQLFNQRSYGAMATYLEHLPVGLLAVLGLLLGANLLRVWLLVRFAGCTRYPWPARLALLGLVGYVAVLTGPLGAARFAVPVLPLLLAGAAAGLNARRVAGLPDRSAS